MALVKVVVSLHIFAFLLGGIVFWALLTDRFPFPTHAPQIQPKWFGKGLRSSKEDASVRPFKIQVKDSVLSDLKSRISLDLARLKSDHREPLEDVGFSYGFNNDFMTKTLAEHWLNKYDWKAQEKMLNKFPQFMTAIDGLDIHFLHVKPDAEKAKGKRVLPLLMVHGWPGSFVEFVKIIPLLTTPRKDVDFVFEVIAPSIPGYGFSSAPAKPGFHGGHCARVFNELMKSIGHPVYYAQGGDWGSMITTGIATISPSNLDGLHLNMAVSQAPSSTLKLFLANIVPSLMLNPKDYSKVIPVGDKFKFLLAETGYLHIQATKPDTVGTALNTSPLGLAAYIIEKFSTWTNRNFREFPDGKLTEKYTLDELLSNVMIYWITGSITSSMRFYAENMSANEELLQMNSATTSVPTGVAAFPEEIFVQPESFLTSKYKNIVSYSDMKRGGHFAAYEEPELLADDVWAFVAKVEQLKKSQQKTKGEL